ncbi:MAG: hypothetical protein KF752_17315 [Pirellulaceae bacterium]|nr:hypothetical protein [Pirellulaceae bacterium]
MGKFRSDTQRGEDLTQLLGYMNFSSSTMDAALLSACNRIYADALPGNPYAGMPAWLKVQQWLQDALATLAESQSAFNDHSQAASVLELVWLRLLPDYLDFHRDLLFHQEAEGVFNGFFIGKAIEAIVLQGSPWDEQERIIQGAIAHLNDFVGYRPVAVLEGRRLEPYDHEWVRPIPLYIAGAGATAGPYHAVISECLRILQETPEEILRQASFQLGNLDELALDSRAYDFDHPVNQRPNYHFGQWDPHCIDNAGNYRRFVIQQVTLDALLARTLDQHIGPPDQLLFEAASVLAGTILMASGISGSGPGAFQSTTTLASLLGPIAQYRDQFYECLLSKVTGIHRQRLEEEQRIRRQPLGGARQHLNTYLAKHRASQLEHVHLARLFARMGNALAAREQSEFVQVPSARIVSHIDCLITGADLNLKNRQLDEAVAVLPEIMDWIHRGIECGAIVDPWNILGFAGNFARFDGPDSAVHDHRVEDVVHLMETVLALQSRLWRESAASGREDLCQQVESRLRSTVKWWRQFAAHEVAELEATDPHDTLQSAILVAKALHLWHAGGASAGDLRFWTPHLELFDSPKAYALVIESLLDRQDFVASKALLIHWLGQADRIGLQKGEASFSELARRWMQCLERALDDQQQTQLNWSVAQKFFDYLEANAEQYWKPPSFALAEDVKKASSLSADDLSDEIEEEDDDSTGLYQAAYEDVVYNDSTDDGIDSHVPEEQGSDSDTATELLEESNRLSRHLTFLSAVAQMWKGAALSRHLRRELMGRCAERALRLPAMESWASQAAENRQGLLNLMKSVASYRIGDSGTTPDAMTRYDRTRLIKESLLDQIISTAVETADARRLLLANLHGCSDDSPSVVEQMTSLSDDDRLAVETMGGLLYGNRERIEQTFSRLLVALRTKNLLYIPLARGGEPASIFQVRLRRRMLSHLLSWLPRQGFFYQTCHLIETARFMEHHNPIGPGAVTEFDDMFKLGFVSVIRAIVQNFLNGRPATITSATTRKRKSSLVAVNLDAHDGENLADLEPTSDAMIAVLETATEVLLTSWLAHSRTLRLSVLETVDNARKWAKLVEFIQKYGGPIFSQSFLRLGNVRAILHQGVARWIDQLQQENNSPEFEDLLNDLFSGQVERAEAEKLLSVVLEAIIDHYSEYRDYNSTTTQSDRGEMLYMLLDFLRLRVRYDRVSWNLKPIYWTHEVLVRAGCHQAAQQWRRALAERISRESEIYIEQLTELQAKYAMRMPTVADRLHERFTRPMTVDRMRALVGPAIRQYRQQGIESPLFELLIEECKLMMEQPTGVGLDVPQWLSALEAEVEAVLEGERGYSTQPRYDSLVDFQTIPIQQIGEQLSAAGKAMQNFNLPAE